MLKKIVAIGLVALAAVTILAGVLAYSYLKPTAAASGPIQAVPIAQGSSAGTSAASTVYTIDQASSQARFTIDEVLNGSPKTVVGSTDQVAGQIAVTPTAPGTAQVGTIQIDARTLTTDSDQRNQARWIIGGFFQRRGAVAAIDMTRSARPCGPGLGAVIPAE